MKPSRELDALVAEKVMGMDLDPPDMRSNGPTYFDPPAYSTSIEDAWEVVEKLKNLGFQLHFTPSNGWTAGFEDSLWSESPDSWTEDGFELSAPYAICLAALKAVRVEIDKEPGL